MNKKVRLDKWQINDHYYRKYMDLVCKLYGDDIKDDSTQSRQKSDSDSEKVSGIRNVGIDNE